jgi:hypothetical protein
MGQANQMTDRHIGIVLIKPKDNVRLSHLSQRSRIVGIAHIDYFRVIEEVGKYIDGHDTLLRDQIATESDQSDGPYNGPSQSDDRLAG